MANSVLHFFSIKCQLQGRFLLLAVVCLTIVSGCSSESQKALQQESSNLKLVAVMYGQCIGINQGRPPASEEAFKKFIDSRGKHMMERFEVSSVDQLLVSERDNLPFVILYGKPPVQGYVAYEQEGIDGVRFVATSLGGVEEMDAATFQSVFGEAGSEAGSPPG